MLMLASCRAVAVHELGSNPSVMTLNSQADALLTVTAVALHAVARRMQTQAISYPFLTSNNYKNHAHPVLCCTGMHLEFFTDTVLCL